MKAHEIIDRLATLDEAAAPVEEPEVDPGILPEEPAEPSRERPARRRTPGPFEVPPDFDPNTMPRPKAEDEEESIGQWLAATEQPIEDWEWDGNELRLFMDDGSVEVYNRNQLDDIGILGTKSFAESRYFTVEEIEAAAMEPEAEEEVVADNPLGLPDMPEDDQEINDAVAAEDASGTLDMILGRTATPCAAAGAAEPEVEVIEIEGEAADQITQGISDVVAGILGLLTGNETEISDEKEDDKKSDKKGDEPASKKKDKSKEDKDLKDDEGSDKEKDKKEEKTEK